MTQSLMAGPLGYVVYMVVSLLAYMAIRFVIGDMADAVFSSYFKQKLEYTKDIMEITRKPKEGDR